jgi:tRNA modification GTPase
MRRATAVAGALKLPHLTVPLPCDLYLWPDGRSYTRQPIVEIHTLGSPPLVERVLSHLCAEGVRLAEPGEFTLRAFLAGRLDLTQAEAVLAVIDAADRRQFDVALRQLAGGIAGPMMKLREDLLDLLAQLEAGLDFVEEDSEFISSDELERRLATAAASVAHIAEQMALRAESRELARVVLVGWPNVGKSSLFNALAGRDHALVSPTAGTTRDYLTADWDLCGVRVQLVDTAGIDECGTRSAECGMRDVDNEPGNLDSPHCTPHAARRTQGSALADIAAAAQHVAADQHAHAQVRLLCLDATRPLNAWERRRLDNSADELVVLTKCDGAKVEPPNLPGAVLTSAYTGQGLGELRNRIRAVLANRPCGDIAVVASTAVRCRESLGRAAGSLARAQDLATTHAGEELVAAETRVALNELGKVVGAVYTDDILDRIFSRFCIGK